MKSFAITALFTLLAFASAAPVPYDRREAVPSDTEPAMTDGAGNVVAFVNANNPQ
ncbi:hypothetical protein W97_08179 [Coniosporium apollinis CBS 100218]|uniref:Uncharacterized protein n=1 Tax=Coniosporium apollinis (strain CBS 100218) TaxID=1168221 RepID=R7Z4Q2_CONA1|nr:uncharacterized protein W97_08179 [Coniosporium apollinis CBS 100218]EON68921.1 hypothetical protein W97_08179 [Coniosporium apollinis CBS 100218]